MTQAFDELDDQLQRAGAVADAAEAQGFLCGSQAAAGAMDPATWLPHILGEVEWDSAPVQTVAKTLATVAQDLREQMNSHDLDYALMLPADETPLHERAESLGSWAKGVMAGLGIGGLDKERALSDDAQDFLKDLDEIGQVEFDFENAGEEEEVAYAEIVEYLRMGMLMLYEELQPLEPAAPGPVTH